MAVLLFNGGEQACEIAFDVEEVGFDALTHITATDLFSNVSFGPFAGTFVSTKVPPHGVVMLKCVVPFHDATQAAEQSGTGLKTDDAPQPVATLGPIEIVRDSAAVNCGSAFPVRPAIAGTPQNLDIPDEPCRAWVNGDQEVTMLSTHTQARYDRGPALSKLKHECRIVFNSSWDQVGNGLASPFFHHAKRSFAETGSRQIKCKANH